MAEERQSGAAEAESGDTSRSDGHVRSALAASVSAVLSLSAAVQALRLWEWRPGSPLELGGDATFFTVQIRELLHTGPQSASERLGAPFGQNSGWFPSDDHLHFAIVKLLGLFSDSPFTVAALYFIIGFPASALTAYWLMRQVGSSRLAAVTGSVLFSVLPGHQEKFEHIWLAAYWVLPLGIWLVVTVGLDRPLFPRADRHGDWRARFGLMWPNARTALIVLALGTGGVYYLAFTLILLAAVLIFRFAMGARRELVAPMAVAGSMLALAATAIAYSSRGRGSDLVTGATPAGRSPSESEFFAGKPLDLVLPWYEHRVAALRFITQAYNLDPSSTVEHPALGVVALVGAGALLWVALKALMPGRRRPSSVVGLLAALLILSLAIYTKGGLGSFIALFITPQLRTWSRFYLVIGLLGLTMVALGLTSAQRRWGLSRTAALASAVALLGILDQTNPGVAPDYAAQRARVGVTMSFTGDLEHRLPTGCTVFQLPIVRFPESPPPGQMRDYDHLLPYLTSTSLHWSYGAMRGTSRADWQLGLPTKDLRATAEDLAAAGFCAIEVDTSGYSTANNPAAELARTAGPPVSASSDGRLVAFDLRSLCSRLRAREGAVAVATRGQRVLHPLVAEASGYDPEEVDGRIVRWQGPRGSITLGNMTGGTVRDVRVTFELRAANQRSWVATVIAPDGREQELLIPASAKRSVTITSDVPPGRSQILLSTPLDQLTETSDRRRVSGQLSQVSISTAERGVRAVVAPWPEVERP